MKKNKKIYVLIISVMFIFSLAMPVSADDIPSFRDVVCPRCKAPTVTENELVLFEHGLVQCVNFPDKSDMMYEFMNQTTEYCAANCGYMQIDMSHDSWYIPCEHI